MQELTRINRNVYTDVLPHDSEFDAVVCAGDFHAVAIATLVASQADKPLIAVCMEYHDCTVQHAVIYGTIKPGLRYLYVDDLFAFGRSLSTVFRYFRQCGDDLKGYEPAQIVATYEATSRDYRTVSQ